MNTSLKTTPTPLHSAGFRALSTIAAIALMSKLMSAGVWFGAAYLSGAIALLNPNLLAFLYAQFTRWCHRHGMNPGLLIGVVMGMSYTLVYLLGLQQPAYAQFFKGAETWMKSSFNGIDQGLISMVFNVLRGLFLLYIGIAVVQIVQKFQQQEDWQTMARTPLVVAVSATMGDILAGMIIGTGSSGQ